MASWNSGMLHKEKPGNSHVDKHWIRFFKGPSSIKCLENIIIFYYHAWPFTAQIIKEFFDSQSLLLAYIF